MAKKSSAGGKKKGGQRKKGRMLIWCAAYKSRGQRIKNKKVKLIAHCTRCPNDIVAKTALSKI